MFVILVILISAAPSAWFGWCGKIPSGLLAAVIFPTIISLAAALTVALPTDVGGLWMFVISFVVLAGCALASFGLALGLQRFIFSDRKKSKP